ncbi:MAG: hypothetical protein A2Y16_04345 [Tenericutes bacterium GWF2_57_13]|nr:MAG: hypothetical protein A2Y16_04345 [Tenericutes bacterium GWF2_57_13]
MELRSCRLEERLDAIRLSKSVFKDNMAEQFAVLFGAKNVGRMFLAVDEGRVVSMVNYHFTPVKIGPATINVASVGSVCTDPKYRGQGLASKLLQLAETNMRKEAVDVVVISGEGGIYAAFGSGFAGDMREAKIPGALLQPGSGVCIRPYVKTDLPVMRRIYDADPVRFVRRADEFRRLLQGQTYPDLFADYPIEIIEKGGVPVAYAILEIHKENDDVGIKEMAGDKNALLAAFPRLLEKYRRSQIHCAAAPFDPLLKNVPASCVTPIHQFASLKIIDFPTFAKRMKPYFRSILGPALDSLAFTDEAGAATIKGFGSTVAIADPRELVKVVFGCAGVYPSNATGELGLILSCIFPVPFPWTHSLNYQ